MRCNPTDESCLLFAADGHGDLLKWAYAHGATLTQKCADKIANKGDKELLEFILKESPKRRNSSNAGYKASRFFNKNLYVMAVLGDRRKLIDWLFQEKCKHSWRVSEAAAYRGDLELLISLQTRGVEVDFHAAIAASRNGHVHVLKFLRNLGLFDLFDNLKKSATAAVTMGRLEALIWLDSIVTDGWKVVFYPHVWMVAISECRDSIIFWVSEKGGLPDFVINPLTGKLSMDAAKLLVEEKAYKFGYLSVSSIVKLGRTDLYDYINEKKHFEANTIHLGKVSPFRAVQWIEYIADHDVPFDIENSIETIASCSIYIPEQSPGDKNRHIRKTLKTNLDKVFRKWSVSLEVWGLLKSVLRERVWEIEKKNDAQAFEWGLFYRRPRVLRHILERTSEELLGEFFQTPDGRLTKMDAMDLARELIKDDAMITPYNLSLTPSFEKEDAIGFSLKNGHDRMIVLMLLTGYSDELLIYVLDILSRAPNLLDPKIRSLTLFFWKKEMDKSKMVENLVMLLGHKMTKTKIEIKADSIMKKIEEISLEELTTLRKNQHLVLPTFPYFSNLGIL